MQLLVFHLFTCLHTTCSLLCVADTTGVVAGMVVLHERMPSGHGMKAVRLASWLCIMLGVTSLAGEAASMPGFK